MKLIDEDTNMLPYLYTEMYTQSNLNVSTYQLEVFEKGIRLL